MGILLKNIYNHSLITEIAHKLTCVYPSFAGALFVEELMHSLPDLELKARSQLIARGFRTYLPSTYKDAAGILLETLHLLSATSTDQPHISSEDQLKGGMGRLIYLPFLNFISLYGISDPEFSIDMLEKMTLYCTAEFDLRPFLKEHPSLTWGVLEGWRVHPFWQVRRLASEGIRPRLPWGIKVPELFTEVHKIISIIDFLYSDPHPVVRRSVANNLNDIAKDHSQEAVRTAERWLAEEPNDNTQRVVRYGLRYLHKTGYNPALSLLGVATDVPILVDSFGLSSPSLTMGESLSFTIRFKMKAHKPIRLSLFYIIHFRRKKGQLSPVFFKLFEGECQPNTFMSCGATYKFLPLSTRPYFPGGHLLEIRAGAHSLGQCSFTLTLPKDPEKNVNDHDKH